MILMGDPAHRQSHRLTDSPPRWRSQSKLMRASQARHGTWWILHVPHGPHGLRPSASLSMFSTSTIRIFICDDGCVVSQDDVDDDYCHCSDCSDEDQHTCDDCTCPTFDPTCSSAWKAWALSFYFVSMCGFEFPSLSLKHN